MDHSKLRGRIKSFLRTEREFGKQMNMSSTTVTKKLNSERDFTQTEILNICELLEIEINEIPLYFFEKRVRFCRMK